MKLGTVLGNFISLYSTAGFIHARCLGYLVHLPMDIQQICCSTQTGQHSRCTVEPPNKGHFGANSFVPCREVVPISEGPLLEVPLYIQ